MITKEDTALLNPYVTAYIKRFEYYFIEYDSTKLIQANQELETRQEAS